MNVVFYNVELLYIRFCFFTCGCWIRELENGTIALQVFTNKCHLLILSELDLQIQFSVELELVLS